MSSFQNRLVAYLFVALVLGLAINSVWHALPPSVVVIEAGPVGGSYHDSALRYAKRLEAAGLKTEIRANPQTLEIVGNVQKSSPRTDIGFALQALNKEAYPDVASAGQIEIQPLFIFYNVGLGKMHSLVNLRGKRIVMPPEKSVTAETTRAILSLYDIDEKNTRFTYMPLAQGVEELKSGKHDVGFFMLAPTNKMVRDLVQADTLSLLSLSESVGVSRQLDHLKASVVPLGSYDLKKNLPDADVAVIGGVVNVMVRQDINPAVMYTLLEAMKDTHQGQSLVSGKGDFPSAVGTSLGAHPLAAQWARSGTPWVFAKFGPRVASLIDKYWLFALAILVLTEVYRTLRYLYEFVELGATSFAVRILLWLQRRVAAGKHPGLVSRRLFDMAEKVITRESQNIKAKVLLEQVRPAMRLP